MVATNEFKVAAIQMNCELGDKQLNLDRAYGLISEAARQGAQLIVLPELFNTGYRVEEDDVSFAETIPGATTNWMETLCQEFNITLVGCILERINTQGLIYDTSVVTSPEGILGTYRKTHLWDQENTRFKKGESLPIFKLEWGNLGMQICYEVGFPESARVLALKGADIIVYPSAFGKERLYAWDIATRSRALENGCYVIAANRTGTEKNETAFGGHSRITSPQGEVLAEATKENEVIIADIDLDKISEQRRQIPYLRDYNSSLFANELKKIALLNS
ncbi:carbon-nitrogen hydrolase family protein [Bacillus canaveralius]|uniref:Carbon-nitrogen hydrolase family protein n=1 Tax=Bacillus canaveralius TaxID=1403243 RepID=A0A2N5GFL6_9BACI|nr:carbon-nitrogen hydrolase family protein [Bacillus canaveralius]PLR79525.1 carbon-nitrogen hydrolase family protein [Bacillus canaveralius]PLR89058.1 carbon-nitrogen hydrolase family protein [Bacillus canaveralius]